MFEGKVINLASLKCLPFNNGYPMVDECLQCFVHVFD